MPRSSRRIHRYQPVGFNGGSRVPVNVHAEGDDYIVSAAVPGFRPEEVAVEVIDDVLKVHAEANEEENGNDRYLLRELPRGSFSRSLRLPDPIDSSKVEAKIENGVLEIRLPKAEEAKAKTIKVKAR
jgi:HSP20 family protein